MHYLAFLEYFFKHPDVVSTYFLDNKQKLSQKTLEKVDISEKFRKFSRNLEQTFENFDENFQKEI